MTRKSILEQATQIVSADRENQYGSPEKNLELIGRFWETYLKTPIVAQDVAIMMCLLKIARIKTGAIKEDNYIDLAGYAACAGEIAGEDNDDQNQ